MIYVTSDMHFGHQQILTYCPGRPGDTVDEMNEILVERWNEVVKPFDHVWILGDAVMGKREDTLKYMLRLNGTKVLIPGNHDKCHPMHRNADAMFELYRPYFADIWRTEMIVSFRGHNLKLNHFPYMGDHTAEPRYNQSTIDKYIPQDEGHFLLHGHTHGENPVVHERQYDVGVDANDYRPILLESLIPMIEGVMNEEMQTC